MATLPIPNSEALQHSHMLMISIYQEIDNAQGHISFARFMELALYGQGLGYYSAGSYKLGKAGDFVTAPEISPLFARCVANQCQQVLNELNGADILEIGAGSGKFAGDLLIELDRLNCLPHKYFILEISADLRDRQRQHFETVIPQFLSRIEWLDTLPTEGIRGIIFANEVLDAMPVTLFRMEGDTVLERCVGIDENDFCWKVTPPTTPELITGVNKLRQDCIFESGYESEINLLLPTWTQTISNTLKQGLILFSDYGYGRREYYHPDRKNGTLMCFYQHHQHSDPLRLVGLQDITAHVDFTTVTESATQAGLQLAGFTTQASFLFACGLLDLAEQENLSAEEAFQQNQAIKILTLPSQMGELVKVIGFTKDFKTPLLGFALHDRRRDL